MIRLKRWCAVSLGTGEPVAVIGQVFGELIGRGFIVQAVFKRKKECVAFVRSWNESRGLKPRLKCVKSWLRLEDRA